MLELEGIDHVALSVSDVERTAQWYIDVFGFERRHQGMWNGIPVFIGKGTTSIALFPTKSKQRSTIESAGAERHGRESPRGLTSREASQSSSGEDIRILHLAFRAVRKNFLAAQAELKRRGIKYQFQDHEISHSIYFRDPDGHRLEITTYEL
jgi:catechol 2,3-dioxygenase-like lactoylglutathione lyase family enzyme